MRAVADSHAAALSVGISLEQIWVIVWFAAGLVALVTGIMWGARSDVSFALDVIALKALPVLILGGLTSIPGAIVGGSDYRHRREAGRILLGPADRRRHRCLVRLCDRAGVPAVPPQGLFGEQIIERVCDETMFYREAGQFKTNYASDQAVFPILQDRIGIWRHSGHRIRGHSAGSATISFINAVMIPFLIFSLAAIGLNLLTGYTGLLSLGTGAFMGVGAYACYKLTTYFPDVNIIIWIIASGFFSAAIGVLFGLPSLRIKGFYLAIATLAAQFFLEWCFIRHPVALQLQCIRRDRGAAARVVRHHRHRSARHGRDALFHRARRSSSR